MRGFLALIALILIAAMLLAGCRSSVPQAGSTPADSLTTGEVPDQVFDGFEMTITDNGILKGLVRAARAEKFGKQQEFRADDLTVLFYTESGRIKSVLTSRRGKIHTDSGDMEAMDSVVVLSADSTRNLLTDHLVWIKGDDLIRGDTAVVVTDPRGVVRGDAFTADVGFEEIQMKNPTGDINVLGTGI